MVRTRRCGLRLPIRLTKPIWRRASNGNGSAQTRKVGEIDAARAIGKEDAGAGLLVERPTDAPGGPETRLGQGGVPGQRVILGDQHIGMAVAVKVDEPEVRIADVAVQARGEGAERL